MSLRWTLFGTKRLHLESFYLDVEIGFRVCSVDDQLGKRTTGSLRLGPCPAGNTGSTGYSGATGVSGAMGATGETGLSGLTGYTGLSGATGVSSSAVTLLSDPISEHLNQARLHHLGC